MVCASMDDVQLALIADMDAPSMGEYRPPTGGTSCLLVYLVARVTVYQIIMVSAKNAGSPGIGPARDASDLVRSWPKALQEQECLTPSGSHCPDAPEASYPNYVRKSQPTWANSFAPLRL